MDSPARLRGNRGNHLRCGASNLTVTELGFYDGPNSALANSAGTFGDGLLESHQVGIFDNLGTLLTPGVTIPAGGGTLINDFRYVTLATPLTLLAGGNYTIAGQIPTVGGNANDVFRNDEAVFTFGSGVTKTVDGMGNTPRSFTGPPGLNPSYTDGVFQAPNTAETGYAGANFTYTVVPEPTSLALAGLSALGFAAMRRRRRA